jgi:hypothetical protein
MGMTDRQFDSYTETQIQALKLALKEVRESGGESEILEQFIEALERRLTRP